MLSTIVQKYTFQEGRILEALERDLRFSYYMISKMINNMSVVIFSDNHIPRSHIPIFTKNFLTY